MEFHKPTKELLDKICYEQGIDPFVDFSERRGKIVGMALDRLGFDDEAEAMLALGRPKKGKLSQTETLQMMQNSRDPALRYLAFAFKPERRRPNYTNQNWLYRLVKKYIKTGMSPSQAAWQLAKNLYGFEYRDIRKAYEREKIK